MGTLISLRGTTEDGTLIGLGDYGGFPPSNVTLLELLLHANPRLVVMSSMNCCGGDVHEPLLLGIAADAEPGREALRGFLDQLELHEQSHELLTTTRAAIFSPAGLSVTTFVMDCSNGADDDYPHTSAVETIASDCEQFRQHDQTTITEMAQRRAQQMNSLGSDPQYWSCVEEGLQMFI